MRRIFLLAALSLGACVNQGSYTPTSEYPPTPAVGQAKYICDRVVYANMTHIPVVDIARLGEHGTVFDRCMMDHGWLRTST
jgi:hypothetical protein